MATITDNHTNGISAKTVHLTPSTPGTLHAPQITPESAQTASKLLQENHDKHHIFFNSAGFHNHIAHHLLAIFSLGATPTQLQRGFDTNTHYQRPQATLSPSILESMSTSRENLPKYFGDRTYFKDFEEFFGNEIEKKGVKGTIEEWVFKGDEVAEGLFTRLFAGLYHPFIHFGYGLEFHQPAILSEAFAQAAIHSNRDAHFFHACEKAASQASSSTTSTTSTPRPSLITLIHSAHSDPTISQSAHPTDENKMADGVLSRALGPMINLASKFTVSPTQSDIRFKTAEMIQSAFYFSAGSQNPAKIPKFDFFYIHCTNSSVFFSSLIEDPVNQEIFFNDEQARKNLARMLEIKGRYDLAVYVSRGAPELYMDRIREYEPKHPEMGWEGLFERACGYEDDGHLSKLIRAARNGERVCKEYEEQENWPVRGDMWLKIGHMAMDSVEAGGPRWVRSTGFEKEWNDVPDLKARL